MSIMSRSMQPKIGDEPIRLAWNSRRRRFSLMFQASPEAGATKGLDGRGDYHIIKNSFKAAAAGSGAAGKTWGAGRAPRRIFQKKH